MTREQKIIRAKVGLLELAKQLGNVSQACKMMGYSRDSFYRFKELYDKGGELALQEISRRKPVLKNRTPIEIEQAVVEAAIDQPAWGQVRVSEMLKRRGLSISPAGVRCVWQRHDLTSMKHRLKALEAKVAQDGILLTEAEIAALKFRPIERRFSRRRSIHAGDNTEATRAEDAANLCQRSYRIAPKVNDIDGKRGVKSCVAEGARLRRGEMKSNLASIDQGLVECGGFGHHRLGNVDTSV